MKLWKDQMLLSCVPQWRRQVLAEDIGYLQLLRKGPGPLFHSAPSSPSLEKIWLAMKTLVPS